jgi:hypothetical protein
MWSLAASLVIPLIVRKEGTPTRMLKKAKNFVNILNRFFGDFCVSVQLLLRESQCLLWILQPLRLKRVYSVSCSRKFVAK